MDNSQTLQVPLSEHDRATLQQAAEARGVSLEEEAAAAIAAELAHRRAVLAEIDLGLEDAEAGRWASEGEIREIFARNAVRWP